MTVRQLQEHELHEIVPAAGDRVALFLDALNNTCARFDISTSARQAPFLANVAEESGSFRLLEENLHYKNPSRVQQLFQRHFLKLSLDDVKGYMEEPALFASRIYANRMGNGDEASGDGWRYRGRGLIQVTGKDNYRVCGTALGMDLLSHPDLLLLPRCAALSAGWFWRTKGLNALADAGDFEGVCVKINGGTLGMKERVEFYEQALKVLS